MEKGEPKNQTKTRENKTKKRGKSLSPRPGRREMKRLHMQTDTQHVHVQPNEHRTLPSAMNDPVLRVLLLRLLLLRLYLLLLPPLQCFSCGHSVRRTLPSAMNDPVLRPLLRLCFPCEHMHVCGHMCISVFISLLYLFCFCLSAK